MKNKKIIIPLLALGLSALTTISCKEDYLDIVPTDRVSDASILNDSTLFESYVINRYLGVRLTNKEGDGNVPGFGRGFEYALWSSLTDESIYNNDDNTWFIQQGQLSPENTGIAGTFWGRSYRSIRECNYALTNISEVGMSESYEKILTAELRFIRAFRYHDLIRNYGQVVLMGDKVSQLGEDFSDPAFYEKASLDEGLAYVTAELDAAAADLPAQNSGNWKEGRATKGAALALNARLKLYAASPLYTGGQNDAQKWQEAAQAAKAVMDMQQYSLYQGGYGQLFLTPNSNVETIFARYYNINSRHTALEIANGPNGYDGWAGNVPLQNLVDDYEMMDGSDFSWDNPEQAAAPYENRDPRFYETVLYNGADYRDRQVETFIPGGRDSKDGPANWNTTKSGYYLRKFVDESLPIQNPWNVAGTQNWTYFRYAEVLLNYAEAQNEAVGPDATVYDAVNSIRSRTGVEMPDLPTGLSQSEMRERIRRERRIELAFEEHRYYDVRRWMTADVVENKPAYGIEIIKAEDGSLTYNRMVSLQGKSFSTQHYWLPIPRAEILASNSQLQQNPGYN
ncbi:RagB/SusD family nutrient uptake outer membrane protein [Arcticibacterium luteifluviistationis]|uniref:RagB/SusD family nutrient uptake outer membrane protein n=1 Tax=Arcticibacterium luteifluviistationis TaxID=1784714 RepID=A0A2Z4GC89_9BACT|nr:RagB/SusD family nutrient uptake outer membrane protein [Arcticibacterium luteifluviistationis]AWV98543.1 RagB/SusD family nutrient uptake outer membrane protein [Arcticibacterium luteifluviistationis]